MAKKQTFDQLRAQWYKKLKKSGFNDIETFDGRLSHYISSDFYPSHYTHDLVSTESKIELEHTIREARTTYYQLASQFLHDHKFKNKYEMTIWELHSEGMSHKSISLTVSNSKKLYTLKNVRTIIESLRRVMLGGLE